jgi:hypothetical protein
MTLSNDYESIINEFDPENKLLYYKVVATDLYDVLKLIYSIATEGNFKERVFKLASDIGRFGEKFVESEFKDKDGQVFFIISDMMKLQRKYNIFTNQIKPLSQI